MSVLPGSWALGKIAYASKDRMQSLRARCIKMSKASASCPRARLLRAWFTPKQSDDFAGGSTQIPDIASRVSNGARTCNYANGRGLRGMNCACHGVLSRGKWSIRTTARTPWPYSCARHRLMNVRDRARISNQILEYDVFAIPEKI